MPTLPLTLRTGPREDALRSEIRSWIAAHDPGPPPHVYDDHMAALVAWQARLAEAGFIGVSWPERYGGRGLGLAAEAVFAEELANSSMPELVNRLAVYTWAPTLLEWGTEEQRERFLPGMRDASEVWCQSFSEPDAGSDLSSIRTRAVRDGDTFVVTGQKVWTSRANLSRWNALLVRTNPDAPPRHGLSILITDMTSPGIVVRPLLQMLHEPHFSEVFFDDVRVPVANVLGGIDNGWKVSMAAMTHERGLFVLERSIRLHRRLADLARALTARQQCSDRAVAMLGDVVTRLEILQAKVYSSLAEQANGTLRNGATSVDKLLLAESDQALFAAAFDILGETVALEADGWSHDLLVSRSSSIYSGTSEIQRNVVARQLLGLVT
jgi:alkylation response protein AidB-like acyl-CoA dehydrogenase